MSFVYLMLSESNRFYVDIFVQFCPHKNKFVRILSAKCPQCLSKRKNSKKTGLYLKKYNPAKIFTYSEHLQVLSVHLLFLPLRDYKHQ